MLLDGMEQLQQDLGGWIQKMGLSEISDIGYAVWQCNIVFKGEQVSILKQTKRTMVRAMCGMKLMNKKHTDELMNMLEIRETVENFAKASRVWWYGHVLRRNENDVLREALSFKVEGQKRKTITEDMETNAEVEEEIRRIGLQKEDALNRTRWRNGVNLIMW